MDEHITVDTEDVSTFRAAIGLQVEIWQLLLWVCEHVHVRACSGIYVLAHVWMCGCTMYVRMYFKNKHNKLKHLKFDIIIIAGV